MKRAMLILACMSMTACTNFYPPSRIAELKPNTRYWVSYDASRRGAWLSTGADASKLSSCSEPAPDVALSLATTLKGKGSAGGTGPSAEAELSATATALALAGRDNVVLLAREALFRICEQAAAGRIAPQDIRPMFDEVLAKTESIARAQAEVTKADTKKAAVEALKKAPNAETVKALNDAIQ